MIQLPPPSTPERLEDAVFFFAGGNFFAAMGKGDSR
jgi:hypothetical protein